MQIASSRILITGANRGIGRALTERASELGAPSRSGAVAISAVEALRAVPR